MISTTSISKAARRLGVTPQAASRSVARLEQALDVTLFRRTTRSITPTDAARAYYKSTREALELLARAESVLTEQDAERAGVVRFSVPTTYGHHRLLPSLAAFRERYPRIELSVAREDIGKVIGKDGRTAQSIRTLLSAAASKTGRRAHLDIVD